MKWLRQACSGFIRWSGWADDALQEAFDAGVAAQREHGDRRLVALQADHQRTLAIHVAAAEHRGRMEIINVFEHLIDAEFPDARGGRIH